MHHYICNVINILDVTNKCVYKQIDKFCLFGFYLKNKVNLRFITSSHRLIHTHTPKNKKIQTKT
jgi:hypothetical protein